MMVNRMEPEELPLGLIGTECPVSPEGMLGPKRWEAAGSPKKNIKQGQIGATGVAVHTQPQQALPWLQRQESSWPPGGTVQTGVPVPCQLKLVINACIYSKIQIVCLLRKRHRECNG